MSIVKSIILTFVILFLGLHSYSQKQILDTANTRNWPSVDEGQVSNDGNYVLYNLLSGNKFKTIVYDVKSRGQQVLEGQATRNARFSYDSMRLLYTVNDTLHRIILNSQKDEFVTQVDTYQSFLQGRNEYLLLERRGGETLIFQKMSAAKPICSINNVQRYWPDLKKHRLFVWNKNNELVIFDLKNWNERIIWKGDKLQNVIWNEPNNDIAFTSGTPNELRIWYYKTGMLNAEQVLSNATVGIKKHLVLNGIIQFSFDGKQLFFTVQKKGNTAKIGTNNTNAAHLTIWSYHDIILPEYQHLEEPEKDLYLYQFDVRYKSVRRLLDENERILDQSSSGWIYAGKERQSEEYWIRQDGNPFLLNIYSGRKVNLVKRVRDFSFSQDGKYCVFYDIEEGAIFSVRLADGKMTKIMSDIPGNDDYYFDNVGYRNRGLLILGWLKIENALLVQDSYDIWLLPIDSSKKSVCLTKNFGRSNHIRFDLAIKDDIPAGISAGSLLVYASNYTTLKNGYYRIDLNGSKSPVELLMDDYAFGKNARGYLAKAKDSEFYLLMRQSFIDAPNYFSTRNFKNLTQISNLKPHENLQWAIPKPMTWTNEEGRFQRGVLFVPENFEATKKYPVIVTYYEKLATDVTHLYPGTYGFDGGGIKRLTIPWFVSHGYLVFIPDIRPQIGIPGQSALNSVNYGVDELISLKYVDSTKIGIQGHSYGGFETDYIVTHSNRFSAAISASGVSDLVSAQGNSQSTLDMSFIENSQMRMGAVLWERPDRYIENSSVFNVDKVSTPLLIMHNKENTVPFGQGVEFFLALRRAGKRAWLLQYDKESHVVGDPKNLTDYLTRMEQFFAHYLKGAPAPVWMTRGIPARDKGKVTGYEYDTEIKTPGPGLPSPEEQKKIDEYSKIPLSEKLKRFEEPPRN